jgi:hypothetical protein
MTTPATPRRFWIKNCVAWSTREQAEAHYRDSKSEVAKQYDMANSPIIEVIEAAHMRELLGTVLFDLQMYEKTGGYNFRTADRIREALQAMGEK